MEKGNLFTRTFLTDAKPLEILVILLLNSLVIITATRLLKVIIMFW